MSKENESSPQLGSALIVGVNLGCSRPERVCLRQMKVLDARTLTAGAAAAWHLLRRPTDIVFCHERLEDMSGLDFLRLLRLHPRLAGLPVVMVSSDGGREAVVQAVEAGCSGYLIRPYSFEAFLRQVGQALRWVECRAEAGAGPAAEVSEETFARALDGLLAPQAQAVCARKEAEQALQEGLSALATQDFDQAMACFERAAGREDLCAEAYMGLAKAWKGKGHPANYRLCLQKAGELFAAQDRLLQVRSIFQELRRSDPAAPNPYLTLGLSRLQQGDYAGAGQAYARSLRLVTERDAFFAHLSRACHFTGEPDRAARELCRRLAGQAGLPPEKTLYARIMGDLPGQGLPQTGPRNGLIPGFPNLQDVLAVARYTFQVYRDKGAPQPQEM